jgi:ATP-dependent Clp protease protease subunit
MSNLETKTDEFAVPSLDQHHYYMFNQPFDAGSTGGAMTFILTRNFMENKHRPKQIKMIINSPGGELHSCFALIDTMKGSKIPIWTFGLGMIASCGLLTFIAGEKGRRYITRNTSILSHQYSWGSFGKEHELFATVKEFNNTTDRIVEHYRKCTGLSDKKIKEILLPPEDVWLDAKEAVKYGLADKIADMY